MKLHTTRVCDRILTCAVSTASYRATKPSKSHESPPAYVDAQKLDHTRARAPTSANARTSTSPAYPLNPRSYLLHSSVDGFAEPPAPPTKSASRHSLPRCRNSFTSTEEHPHIGNYRLLKTIGKGNFAKVKLARHVLTGRESSVQHQKVRLYFVWRCWLIRMQRHEPSEQPKEQVERTQPDKRPSGIPKHQSTFRPTATKQARAMSFPPAYVDAQKLDHTRARAPTSANARTSNISRLPSQSQVLPSC
ncbi:hypothetical protein WMY93_007599 [Mugilogobius chulae]|uniref:Protein kinase domain-containing protein n=1 Tax=Mugilogobius chulae TaxID=88201 RepID=A0AAW0PS30_9GOBI